MVSHKGTENTEFLLQTMDLSLYFRFALMFSRRTRDGVSQRHREHRVFITNNGPLPLFSLSAGRQPSQ